MKIDRRIDYKIVIDTETCPVDRGLQKVEGANMFTYDIGWAVVDKRGNVYEQRSFIVADIFLGEKSLMQSAYYSNKIPQYEDDLISGKRKLAPWKLICWQFRQDIEKYEVNKVFAHNMRFDYGTLNTTQRWLSKSQFRYFFPYGLEICDTLMMARDVLGTMPTYIKFCEENNFVTKGGKPQFSAEVCYRYIINDPTYIEEHTALEDVMIEKEIMAYCYKQHKKMRRKLW